MNDPPFEVGAFQVTSTAWFPRVALALDGAVGGASGGRVMTGIGVGDAFRPLLGSTGGPKEGVKLNRKPESPGLSVTATTVGSSVGLAVAVPEPLSMKRAARTAMRTKIRIVAESRQSVTRRFGAGAVRPRAGAPERTPSPRARSLAPIRFSTSSTDRLGTSLVTSPASPGRSIIGSGRWLGV